MGVQGYQNERQGDNWMDLPAWVTDELRVRGIKQKTLGDEMGWSDSKTSKVLGGSLRLRADELLQIIAFFEYRLPSYLGGKSEEVEGDTAIGKLASKLDEEQQQALLVYLKLLPQRKDR